MAKLTQKAVADALMATHGNVSAAARKLSVTRKAIQQRIAADPELQQAVTDARESMVDDAETALAAAVLAGEAWAVCFTLKTMGKDRGYTEKTIVVGDPSAPLQVEHSGHIAFQASLTAEDAAFAESLARAAAGGGPDPGVPADGGSQSVDHGSHPDHGQDPKRQPAAS